MGQLLVVAKLDAERKRSFGTVATACKLELVLNDKLESAIGWLELYEPAAVVFDTTVAHAEKLCSKVRAKKKLSSVPIIALASDTSDAFVERLYALGVDDVIALESRAALVARLRALPDRATLSTVERGLAVVAERDHARSDLLGRVLSNAGYESKLALDDVALRFYTSKNEPRLIVVSADLGDPRVMIEESRKRGSTAAWIVMAARKDLLTLATALDGLNRVTVLAASTAPENVLFSSNELLREGAPPARSSERSLYGTVVAFKPSGSEAEDLGFTYNVSTGGLFIRTLAPPEEDTVWVELRPARCNRRVRLEGRIAWRRRFDLSSAAAAPPGFGIALTDGLGESLTLWKTHTDAFVGSTRTGPRAVGALLGDRTEGDGQEAALTGVNVRSGDKVDAAFVPEPPAPNTPKLEVREMGPESALAVMPPSLVVPTSPEPEAPVSRPVPSRPPPLPPASVPVPQAQPVQAEFAPQKSSRGWVYGLVLVAVLVGAGAAFYAASGTESQPVASAPPPPNVSPAAPPSKIETPAPTSAAPVVTQPTSVVDAAPVEVEADDGEKLGPTFGYLIVNSPQEGDIYASGMKVGPVGKKNETPCGMRYVRIGKGSPPAWIGEGKSVDVKCRATTEVTLPPPR
jgi:DNA-binding response OmpR family regulator